MRSLLVVCLLSVVSPLTAGQSATIRVAVRSNGNPVPDAEVSVGSQSARTDASGVAVLSVPPGEATVIVLKETFAPVSTVVSAVAGQQREVDVDLVEQPSIEETVLVSATRTGGRLDDQPIRVEVLEREEIEEKLLMTPGDIVMMLNEMGGMRVQATSPSIGAASVRVQGMRGRYTRFLSDGLPLFGEVGGLGLLQIPPMDLGQVEVIKGVASSLYGADAMGGVVNLVSRQPEAKATTEFLLNRSTRGATDAVMFAGVPMSKGWAMTILGGGHWQELFDADDDGWSDLPQYSRGIARPRMFWSDDKGNRFFATAGVTIEDRRGGSSTYVDSIDTRAFDLGLLDQRLLSGRYVLTSRAAWSQKHHDHLYAGVPESDRHSTVFGEMTLRSSSGAHTWIAGAAVESDRYRGIEVTRFNYSYTTPGVFAQDDIVIAPWMLVSASARLDHHSEFGTFLSPRVSGLFRSGNWNSRVSIGTGFFGPSALTEETEAAGLTRLEMSTPLRAERGRSASIDVTRSVGAISATLTFFASQVRDSIKVDRDTVYAIRNEQRTTNRGIEALVTFRRNPFSLTGTYTFVQAQERDNGVETTVALTPTHSAGVVGMWEKENVGRVGVEVYFTGTQLLEVNPYADTSEPYTIVGVLAERQFGRLRFFVNGENLTDVRQTKWQSLVRPAPGPDGRFTVDAWAPLDGRNINGGIRVRF